jgi:hypothetical protein
VGLRPTPHLWAMADRFVRVSRRLNEGPTERLARVLALMPLPACYDEAAVALRKMVSEDRKAGRDVRGRLTQLHELAQQHAFCMAFHGPTPGALSTAGRASSPPRSTKWQLRKASPQSLFHTTRSVTRTCRCSRRRMSNGSWPPSVSPSSTRNLAPRVPPFGKATARRCAAGSGRAAPSTTSMRDVRGGLGSIPGRQTFGTGAASKSRTHAVTLWSLVKSPSAP